LTEPTCKNTILAAAASLKKFKLIFKSALLLALVFSFFKLINPNTVNAQAPNCPLAIGRDYWPVIFIPGQMATSLEATADFTTVERIPFGDGDKVWATTHKDQAPYYALELTDKNGVADPSDPNKPPYPVDVVGRYQATGKRDLDINSAVLSVGPKTIHQSTFDWFTGYGYQYGCDLFTFGWDWRQGAGQKVSGVYRNVQELDQMIEDIRDRLGIDKNSEFKVHLVAHSQGGYVAWLYLSQHSDKVASLTTLGTPYLGSAKSTAALLFGVNYSGFGYGLRPTTVRRIARTFPGLAELMPHKKYPSVYFFDMGNFFGGGKRTYSPEAILDKTKEFLRSGNGDPVIINKAKIFHEDFANVLAGGTRGVPVRVIIGSGSPTRERLFTNLDSRGKPTKEAYTIFGGDGTVEIESAKGGVGAFYYVRGFPGLGLEKTQDHLELTQQEPSMRIVLNTVKGRPPLEGVTLSQVSSTPFPLRSHGSVQIRSPLNIHAYDSSGNHTGLDSSGLPEENISDSYFEQLGEADEPENGSQDIVLPPGQTYEIRFDSVASGPDTFGFALTKREEGGSISQMVIYQDVSIGPVTKGKMIWDGSTPVPIQLDQNNDGIFEQQVQPTITDGANDPDNDRLKTGEEILYYGTDPNNPHSDGDRGTYDQISYWKLDGGGVSVASDSADSNHGTLVNGPVWTTGKVSGALSFDGVDDYVEVADAANLDIASAITLEAWIKPDTMSGYETIVSKYYLQGYYLRVHESGEIHFTPGVEEIVTSPGLIQSGSWYHVVGTYDGTTIKLYLNGVLIGSKSTAGPVRQNDYPLRIGDFPGGGLSFNGLIDEVAVYNRALLDSEVQKHYQNGLSGNGYRYGDGFMDGVEVYMGTDPMNNCANDTTHDAWPPDFDNNKRVDIIDVLFFNTHMGAKIGDSNYDKRYDLDVNGTINIIDILFFGPYMQKTCT